MTKQELQHKVEVLELKLQVKELELKIAELERNTVHNLAPFTQPNPFPYYPPTFVGDGYGVPLDNPFPCTATGGTSISVWEKAGMEPLDSYMTMVVGEPAKHVIEVQ